MEERIPRPGRSLLLRAALAGFLIVGAVAGGVAYVALSEVGRYTPPEIDVPEGRKLATDKAPTGEQTILLLGSDKRYGDKGGSRSDTVMLVRLDPSEGATALLSLPRDLEVDIPGYGRDKLNAAYSIGREPLVTDTLKRLFGQDFKIHHVVNIDFKGFRRAIDALGCTYVDVDRRYFNSNAGVPRGRQYAEIDLQPGYQRLCGQRALDFARHRYSDNDLVRGVRQQRVLAAVRDQLDPGTVLDKRTELTRIFARSTRTDSNLATTKGLLRTVKLAAYAAGKPIVQVPLGAGITPDGGVAATPQAIRSAKRRFLHVGDIAPRRATRSRTPSSGAGAGLVAAGTGPEDALVRTIVDRRSSVPAAAPRQVTAQGRLVGARAYEVRDDAGRRRDAYRLVFVQDQVEGQFYGVQGTSWRTPPLLDRPDERKRVGGRMLLLVRDGRRLRHVGWRTKRGAYWVSNTLSLSLTDRQMLGIAGSVKGLG